MSIIPELSNKFGSLTTDAVPDPPRIPAENDTLSSNEVKPKRHSESTIYDMSKTINSPSQKRQSVPNTATPIENTEIPSSSTKNNFKNCGNSRTKTKPKCRASKNGTIKYNIINSNGVKIGSTTNYICTINQYSKLSQNDDTKKSRYKLMPQDIQTLSASKTEITQEDIFLIKTHIGHGWKDVARKIGYSDGQIEQFLENYKINGIDQVIYHLLLEWKQANTKDACIGDLVNVMWSCQEYDCVERLAALHKVLA